MTEQTLEKLLTEVEALYGLYLAKDAEGERWADTLERIDRMWRLAKSIRKHQAGRGRK